MIHDTRHGEATFDEDYYVIDEPPAPAPVEARDPLDDRVVREQLLDMVPTSPWFQIYWTVPMDVDWDD